MPICIPKSKSFPDKNGWVYVAGWGSHHEARTQEKCTTNHEGPDPYSKCKYPFRYLNMVWNQCIKSPTPSGRNDICMKLNKEKQDKNKTRINFLDKGYSRVRYTKDVLRYGLSTPH